MFGWEYPPRHFGGLGVACQGLVRGLLGNGVKVTLVLPFAAEGDGTVDIRSPDRALLETLRVASALQPYDSAADFRKRSSGFSHTDAHIYGENLAAAVDLFTASSLTLTKDLTPDVVHCHDWMTYAAGIRASDYHRRPLVTHIHATELDRTHFHPNEWIYSRERQGFIEANRIIAVSHYTKNMLVEHYGIDPDKISVVHNGSDEAPLRPTPYPLRPHRNPLVLFLGRLTLQKGPEHFLSMAAYVHRHRPDVQFVIAGDGPMLPSLIEHAIRSGLQDCIIFAGKVNRPEARHLFAQADCFVMPSLSEPFGLVALEAIAQGTPVILSKQSGASEVVRHGFHVDFWDTEKMADCVLTILRDQPLAAQLTSEAPRILQKLTWMNQAAKVQSIYHDLLHT